jgi:hypothetical protein
MATYHFEREARTPYSEAYSINDGEHSLGRVDLHYTSSATYATLAVHTSIGNEALQELLGAIDERLVSSADPYREDLVVTVWRGEEVGVFADDSEYDDDDYDDDEDDER